MVATSPSSPSRSEPWARRLRGRPRGARDGPAARARGAGARAHGGSGPCRHLPADSSVLAAVRERGRMRVGYRGWPGALQLQRARRARGLRRRNGARAGRRARGHPRARPGAARGPRSRARSRSLRPGHGRRLRDHAAAPASSTSRRPISTRRSPSWSRTIAAPSSRTRRGSASQTASAWRPRPAVLPGRPEAPVPEPRRSFPSRCATSSSSSPGRESRWMRCA